MRTPNIIILFISLDVCNPFTNLHHSIYKIRIGGDSNTQINLSYSVRNEVDNRNLYEILEVERDAPRSEIRKSYIKLAKTFHPDANIDGVFPGRTTGYGSAGDDFDKVAKAWKILSNDRERLRYDRSLRAKEFVDDVDESLSRVSQRAAATVRPILDKFIRPFFRGASNVFTTAIAATMSNFGGGRKEVTVAANNTKSAFSNVRYSGNTDTIQTIEKIEELEQRTLEDTKLIQYLQEKLLQQASKKSSSYLRVDIDQIMTSEDARNFLRSIRAPDQRHFEIDTLKTIESDYELYEQKNQELLKQINYYNDVVIPQSQKKLEAAQMTEEEERQVMIATKEFEQSYKADAEDIMQSLRSLREDYKSSTNDLQNSYERLITKANNSKNKDVLEEIEAEYLSKKIANKALQKQVYLHEESYDKMLSKSKAAYLAGVEASKVLMKAQDTVRSNQQNINKARTALSAVQQDYEYNKTELYKISVALTRQREQVRKFLKSKQKQSMDLGEQQLINEIRVVEDRIRRLQSRANELKSKVNF